MIVADAVKLTQSGLGDSQSVKLKVTQSGLGDTDSQPVNRTTLFSLSQTNYHSNHR